MFSKIQNPDTGNWVDVNGPTGRKVLRNYVQYGGMMGKLGKLNRSASLPDVSKMKGAAAATARETVAAVHVQAKEKARQAKDKIIGEKGVVSDVSDCTYICGASNNCQGGKIFSGNEALSKYREHYHNHHCKENANLCVPTPKIASAKCKKQKLAAGVKAKIHKGACVSARCKECCMPDPDVADECKKNT